MASMSQAGWVRMGKQERESASGAPEEVRIRVRRLNCAASGNRRLFWVESRKSLYFGDPAEPLVRGHEDGRQPRLL